VSAVLKQLRADRGRWLAELDAFLRIESVSADPARADEVHRAADWVARQLTALGLTDARVIRTSGHPIVTASWLGAGPDRPTVLVYCHYDVQPEDPVEGWDSPPFVPTVTGDRLVARGAADDKGWLVAHLAAARAWLSTTGGLPVNLRFLFDGEEETGSAGLAAHLAAHADEFACDLVVVSDTSMLGPEQPSICVGMRGLACLEVTVTGPTHDLHSGKYGGGVANPALVLARMLAALHDADGRVAVPGFYDRVVPLPAWQRAELAALPFDEADWCASIGVPKPDGEAGFGTLERLWTRPTLEVNGLVSGYTGEGSKTIVPARATAKISCRLVPDQRPEEITALVADRLRALAPPTVRVEVTPQHGGPPAVIDRDHPVLEVAARAYTAGYGIAPVFTREGGSVPIVELFQRVLGVEVLLLGFGLPDQNEHAPNEYLSLTNFARGTETIAHLWHLLAEVDPAALAPSRTTDSSRTPQKG